MKIQKVNNEVIIKFPLGTKMSRIEKILDYLRFEQLSATSQDISDADVETLLKDVKSGSL